MVVYTDILSGDEIISDSCKIIDIGDGVWEVDGKMFQLENQNVDLGANPSTEEVNENAEEETKQSMMLDLAYQFRWTTIPKVTIKTYTADLKAYAKRVLIKMQDSGQSSEEIANFKTGISKFLKKIEQDWAKYDVYMGESMDENSMHILVAFREDGVTPYATVLKHGLEVKR